ncbi:MAG TPA: S-layer homology domain-containing protein [Acidimicrobiia bacterium]|nr:S-layer homology domain-containing protein [Acidimicrobiia bacterium]
MSDIRPRRVRRVSITTVIVLAITTALSTAVIAAHNFNDVPDTNTFHEDIEWLAENRVTIGCNPPANTEFCPEDNVTREQMSAFMHRLARTMGAVGTQVTDSSDPVAVGATSFTQLATVQVVPQDEANVTLNAHAHIAVAAGADVDFDVIIARDSCEGTVVGAAGWSTLEEGAQTTTVSVTGSDQVTATTTYALCAAKGAEAMQDGTVFERGVIADWVPTY